MKKLFLLSFLFFAAFSFTNCEDEMEQSGSIIHMDLEGGFYGIIGNDGMNFDPVNLPDEYKVNGLDVRFKFKIAKNQMSIHQWGTLIEITFIEKAE